MTHIITHSIPDHTITMGLPGNMDKIALLMIALAFQFHSLCMATTGKYYNTDQDKDDATKAFLIIAFILYLAAFILSVLINFGNLDNKIAKILTVVACIAGGEFKFPMKCMVQVQHN